MYLIYSPPSYLSLKQPWTIRSFGIDRVALWNICLKKLHLVRWLFFGLANGAASDQASAVAEKYREMLQQAPRSSRN